MILKTKKTFLEYFDLYQLLRDDSRFSRSEFDDHSDIFEGENLHIFVTMGGSDIYNYFDGSGGIIVERDDCFNKWSQAPLAMRFPINRDTLNAHLEFLLSEEGYKYSNEWESGKLPNDLQEVSTMDNKTLQQMDARLGGFMKARGLSKDDMQTYFKKRGLPSNLEKFWKEGLEIATKKRDAWSDLT